MLIARSARRSMIARVRSVSRTDAACPRDSTAKIALRKNLQTMDLSGCKERELKKEIQEVSPHLHNRLDSLTKQVTLSASRRRTRVFAAGGRQSRKRLSNNRENVLAAGGRVFSIALRKLTKLGPKIRRSLRLIFPRSGLCVSRL